MKQMIYTHNDKLDILSTIGAGVGGAMVTFSVTGSIAKLSKNLKD